jgi:hypothetical protein
MSSLSLAPAIRAVVSNVSFPGSWSHSSHETRAIPSASCSGPHYNIKFNRGGYFGLTEVGKPSAFVERSQLIRTYGGGCFTHLS